MHDYIMGHGERVHDYIMGHGQFDVGHQQRGCVCKPHRIALQTPLGLKTARPHLGSKPLEQGPATLRLDFSSAAIPLQGRTPVHAARNGVEKKYCILQALWETHLEAALHDVHFACLHATHRIATCSFKRSAVSKLSAACEVINSMHSLSCSNRLDEYCDNVVLQAYNAHKYETTENTKEPTHCITWWELSGHLHAHVQQKSRLSSASWVPNAFGMHATIKIKCCTRWHLLLKQLLRLHTHT